MAINQAYPSLNGVEPSWADISITATTTGNQLLDMSGIAGIKWSRKVTVGKRRGASGGRIMKRTTGEIDYEASISFYRSDLLPFETALGNEAPVRGNQRIISLVSWDVHVIHTPPNDTNIYETWIKGCRYLTDDDDMKEGSDPDKFEIGIDPIEIVRVIDGVEYVLL
jgi:hypothetical protein